MVAIEDFFRDGDEVIVRQVLEHMNQTLEARNIMGRT
jgi:cytochrome c-type biogenesis protein CcmE